MSFSTRTLFTAAVFMFAVASNSHAQTKPTPIQPTSIERVYDYFTSFFRGTRDAGEVNRRKCENCDVRPAPTRPIPHPALDRSNAWLRSHLKCNNHAYLLSQRENLIRAERIFGVPAQVVTCVIAAESSWNLNADQLNRDTGRFSGSFVGLVQSNKPTFDFMRSELSKPPLSDQWKQFVPDISPDILRRETMYVPRGIILDCPTRRCGGTTTSLQRDQIGRASIAFVSIYLKKSLERLKEYVSESRTTANADRFMKTQTSQYLAAAIGYNAGRGVMAKYLPNEAFTQDNGQWKIKIKKAGTIAKLGEVVQYLDWIDSCMVGNPAIAPPDRTARLDNKRCFGDTSPAGITKLLSVRRPIRPNCETDSVVPCPAANAPVKPTCEKAPPPKPEPTACPK